MSQIREELTIGSSIKPFQLQGLNEEMFSSDQMKGKYWFLSFHRYAECLYCNIRIHKLIGKSEEWQKKGLQIVTIFQSPIEDIQAKIEKQNPPFLVLSDPVREVYKSFAVEENNATKYWKGYLQWGKALQAFSKGHFVKQGYGSRNLVPANFIIGPDQKIALTYYGKDISDHMPIKQIDKFLSKLD